MATDVTGLQALVRSVRSFASEARSAPEVAAAVEASLRASAGAGTSPDGEAWAPGKESGGRVMAHAADAITVKAVGSVVLVTLTGHDVYHHYGAGRGKQNGKPMRPIIPTAGLPTTLGNAIRNGITDGWNRTVASRKNYTKSGHAVK